jgi:hypothetical protein
MAVSVNDGGKKAGSHAKTGGDSNLEDTGADLTKAEQKAAPDAEDAIEHAADPTAGPTTTEPTNGDELSTESDHPILVDFGSHERHLTDVVVEAKRDSGLTTKDWNALGRRERTNFINHTVERLKADEQKELAKARTEQNPASQVEQQDVRVHETRGIGGRFVALGGGERIRVAEASQQPDAVILSDDELKAQQEAVS